MVLCIGKIQWNEPREQRWQRHTFWFLLGSAAYSAFLLFLLSFLCPGAHRSQPSRSGRRANWGETLLIKMEDFWTPGLDCLLCFACCQGIRRWRRRSRTTERHDTVVWGRRRKTSTTRCCMNANYFRKKERRGFKVNSVGVSFVRSFAPICKP